MADGRWPKEAHMRTRLVAAAVMSWMTALSAQSPPAPRPITLVDYLKGAYGGVKNDLTLAAEAMPAEDYGFRPTSMPEVRTFAETMLHVAEGQVSACSRLLGRPEPSGRVEPPGSKPEVVAALRASFVLCDEALSSLTSDTAAAPFTQFGLEMPRSAAVVGLIAHDAEMYGIATVYLRAKNIVPPSTARQRPNR
jgi:hypothetical protein